ncbi:MAG: ParB/RepB/Spo0J family partition protein [Candidatus Pacebacteria bacterium]|nr:ParB/RepB/Spo0J family partition protein [Candidatus Paceibacterota bacterium]
MLSTSKALGVSARSDYGRNGKGNGQILKKVKYDPDRIYSFNPQEVSRFADQPRQKLDPDHVADLAESMRKDGHREPGVVCEYYGPEKGKYKVILIDGENRLEACKKAGILFRARVEVIEDAKHHRRLSRIANFNRQEHTPMEIALAVDGLRQDGFKWEDISVDLGMSVPTLVGIHALIKLDPTLQARCGRRVHRSERLSLGVAKTLAALPPDEQRSLAVKIKGMSSRKAEVFIENEVAAREIPVQRSHMGRKPRPSDKIDALTTKIKRSYEELELAVHIDEGLLLAGFRSRTLEANAETLSALTQIPIKVQELRKKLMRCIPQEHLKKMGQLEDKKK